MLKCVKAFAVLMASLVIAGCGEEETPRATWHMVNVNAGKLQGDANLIQIGQKTIMIDAGYHSEAKEHLLPYLRGLGIKQIDYFFVSHPHRDHYEGVRTLLENGIKIQKLFLRVPPKEICDREIPWGCNYSDVLNLVDEANQAGTFVIQPARGDLFDFGASSTIEILHAQEGDLPDQSLDINDLSLIMRWSINGIRVLFTGDLNQKVGALLSQDKRIQARFMKMPHHGAEGLAPNQFFDAVNPGYVLVPGPEWVWCSDRGARARQWTEAKKRPTWVNGLDGTVRVEFFRRYIQISPEFSDKGCRAGAPGPLTVSLGDSD